MTFHYDIDTIGKIKNENKRMEIEIIKKVENGWTILFTYIPADAIIVTFLAIPFALN
jgi:hypothetical protein